MKDEWKIQRSKFNVKPLQLSQGKTGFDANTDAIYKITNQSLICHLGQYPSTCTPDCLDSHAFDSSCNDDAMMEGL